MPEDKPYLKFKHTDPRQIQAAKDARTRMGNGGGARGAVSPAERQAANDLLSIILGPRPGELSMGPPPRSFGDARERAGIDRAYPSHPYEVVKGVDPQVDAAFDLIRRSYPKAAGQVSYVTEVPNTRASGDTQGVYTPVTGVLGVRAANGKQPRTLSSILSTLAHELSHATGLDDHERAGQKYDSRRDITAYDIGKAWDIQHSDVNLPAPSAPNKEALLRLLSGKTK